MESPNPQGIPNLKIQSQAPRKPQSWRSLCLGWRRLQSGYASRAPRAPQALLVGTRRPQTGILVPGNQSTSMP
uniref:Uncharacterized protein n=1 Tax=Ursus americanus TaxID=9643 RepID=A0A452S3K6_URSAM